MPITPYENRKLARLGAAKVDGTIFLDVEANADQTIPRQTPRAKQLVLAISGNGRIRSQEKSCCLCFFRGQHGSRVSAIKRKCRHTQHRSRALSRNPDSPPRRRIRIDREFHLATSRSLRVYQALLADGGSCAVHGIWKSMETESAVRALMHTCKGQRLPARAP